MTGIGFGLDEGHADWFGFNADGFPCVIVNGKFCKTLKAFAKECPPSVVRVEQASGERRRELLRIHAGEPS